MRFASWRGSFWLFPSCCWCRLAGMCRNPLLWPYISQPVGFSLPPFVLSREVFADVYKGGMSVIKKCHGCFLGLREIYTNPAHFFVFWSYQVATGPCLSTPGPPCGAICAFHFGQVKVSPLILRLGVAATFPALFPRLCAVILQRAF